MTLIRVLTACWCISIPYRSPETHELQSNPPPCPITVQAQQQPAGCVSVVCLGARAPGIHDPKMVRDDVTETPGLPQLSTCLMLRKPSWASTSLCLFCPSGSMRPTQTTSLHTLARGYGGRGPSGASSHHICPVFWSQAAPCEPPQGDHLLWPRKPGLQPERYHGLRLLTALTPTVPMPLPGILKATCLSI